MMSTAGRRVVLGISGPNVARQLDWATLLVRPADTVHTADASELIAVARGADLVILTAPRLDRDRAGFARLLAGLGCPVAVTPPAEPTPVRSVTVVLHDDRDDDALLESAFDQARRYGCGVLAVECWQPPPEENIRYAETAEQKMLDSYLSGWQERFGDVGVAAELRVGDLAHLVDDRASEADLLILAASDACCDPVLDAVLRQRSHPTLLIPAPAGSSRRVRPAGRSLAEVQPGVLGAT